MELRGQTTDQCYAHLKQLGELLGHRRPMETVEFLVSRAVAEYLAPTTWRQTQVRAISVLRRLRPTLLIDERDIIGVAYSNSGQAVLISVALEAQPYRVSKADWEA